MSDQSANLPGEWQESGPRKPAEVDAALLPTHKLRPLDTADLPTHKLPPLDTTMEETQVLVSPRHAVHTPRLVPPDDFPGTPMEMRHSTTAENDIYPPRVDRPALSAGDVSNVPTRRLTRPLRPVTIARVLFLIALLANLLGIGGIWALRADQVAHATLADLKVRLSRMEALAGSVNGLRPTVLPELQSELTGAKADLQTLDSLIPLSGQLDVGGLGAAHRVLRLGIDALTAADEGIATAQVVLPALQGFVNSVTHPQASATTPGSRLLTLSDVTVAQRHTALAVQAWNQVLYDRAAISSADLRALNNAQITSFVRKLDEYAPSVTTGIQVWSAVLDWSPRLFGLTQPIHFLLFNMDSDELRATGGFLGNYAELTISGGALTSGIHFHDIYTLDCPATDNSFGCPTRSVPSEYSWFTLAGQRFGVRDSNLNPDFPTSAGLAAHLYQVEGGPAVDGVIAITPAVMESVLRILGPIAVTPFHVTITADTLRNLIHYYHQHPEITTELGISASALGTTAGKVFDVLASQAVFAKLGTMTPQQQTALGKALLADLQTKDIQVFVSNTRVEGQLEQLTLAGQVRSTAGDSEFIVDTNDGASYANADVRETISDTVTLNASGGATHALTITHTFMNAQHSYVQSDVYSDLIRVIIPSSAIHLKLSGPCVPVPVTQAYHLALACQFSLERGSNSTIAFSWYVPAAIATGSVRAYQLLLQRQAGASDAIQVTVMPPPGATVEPGSGPGKVVAGHMTWSATPILEDTTLTAQMHK